MIEREERCWIGMKVMVFAWLRLGHGPGAAQLITHDGATILMAPR